MLSPDAPPPHSDEREPEAGAIEAVAWREIRGRWQPLHGSFFVEGISVEWHDFTLDNNIDWARSFHPDCLEMCLNFSGAGWLMDDTARISIEPGQIAMYTTFAGRLRAQREAGSLHRFLTVELSREFIRTHLGQEIAHLKEPVLRFIESQTAAPPWLEIRALPSSLLSMRNDFLKPPIPECARATWYRAKVLAIIAQVLFLDDEPAALFCRYRDRRNQERVERARYLIDRDLENPPSLMMLGKEVGCSSFHLSRIFAEESGMSIPRYIRSKRIERAADLLKSGKVNVTEAAMTVGYSSMSAFTKAFVEQIGCCPGLYSTVGNKARKPRKG
jgi:AraC family transcriptional regulator